MRTIIIVLLAVVVLAGGAFVAYKLTYKRDTGDPDFTVAQRVEKALLDGDSATSTTISRVRLGRQWKK